MNLKNIVALLFVILLVFYFFGPLGSYAVKQYEVKDNSYLPEFSLLNLYEGDGNFTRKDLEGKYTVLTFLASWCGPCMKKHPRMVDLKEEISDVQFYAIAMSDNAQRLQKVLDKKGNPYIKIGRHNGRLKDFGLDYRGIPLMLIVNPYTKVIYAGYGLNKKYLLSAIQTDYQKLKGNI